MSKARAYYNEIDRDAVHVLRSLIADGLIADGDVDDRSIVDVRPADLDGYTQCHFFAGAGLWSVAARMAGWPDDRPLWTGSCPCQPFSAAGRGLGTDDPRHLWPDFFRLIRSCRPPVVMGEQVAGSPGYGWFDGVRADLAGEDFASRVVDIPVCAVDAPHIRQRLWWVAVANANGTRSPAIRRDLGEVGSLSASECKPEDHAALSREGDAAPVDGLAYADRGGRTGRQEAPERGAFGRTVDERAADGSMVNASCVGRREGWAEPELRSGRAATAVADASGHDVANANRRGCDQAGQRGSMGEVSERGALPQREATQRSADGRNGSFWSGSDWLLCHDGKARRTEPGIRLLVDGMAGRVPAWRLAGNSISPVLASEVIVAFREAEGLVA